MKKILLHIMLFTLLFCHITFAGQWQSDDNGTKYLQDDGTYAKGWYQDVDEKWYYLDDNTGYILKDTVTPDGYRVSGTGEWMQDTSIRVNAEEYPNEISLSITAVDEKAGGVLDYAIPLTVRYKDTYTNSNGYGSISVSKVELSKDGKPYITLKMSNVEGIARVTQHYKCVLSDGAYLEGNLLLAAMASDSDFEYNFLLLNGYSLRNVFKDNKVSSVEICITEYVPEN